MSTDQKLADFNTFATSVSSAYVAFKYKQKIGKLHWEQLLKDYNYRIANSKTNSEFYYLLREFLGRFDDSHISLELLNETYSVMIPGLSFDFIEGKVLLSKNLQIPSFLSIGWNDIYELEDPQDVIFLKRGLELVAVDNVSTEEYLENHLQKYLFQSSLLAEKKLATWFLTERSSARFPIPQSEESIFTFLLPSGEHLDLKAKWFSLGEIGEFLAQNQEQAEQHQALPYDVGRFLWSKSETNEKIYFCTSYSRFDLPKNHKVISGRNLIGRMINSRLKKVRLPMDRIAVGGVIAYRYNAKVLVNGREKTKSIGYLRIPHYNYETDKSNQFYQFEVYRSIVAELERETDALVIDQTYNCGGRTDIAHRLGSLFVQKEFKGLPMQQIASWESYNLYKGGLKELKNLFTSQRQLVNPSLIAQYNFYKSTLERIEMSLSDGKYLTEPFSDEEMLVQPNAVRYTKPIIFLVNSLSVSAGDHMPHLIQKHNPKVVLVGESTQGGGGGYTVPDIRWNLGVQHLLPHSGIVYRLPNIMFVKKNMQPLENYGVKPHYSYRVTKEDFVGPSRYGNYRKYYENLIGQQLSTVDFTTANHNKEIPIP